MAAHAVANGSLAPGGALPMACSWQVPWLLIALVAVALVAAIVFRITFFARHDDAAKPVRKGWQLRPGWAQLWPLLVAVGPVLVAAVLVGLLGPLNDPLSPAERVAFQKAVADKAFLGGALTLVAILVAHVCVCTLGIFVAVGTIMRGDRRVRVAWMAAGSGILLSALIFLWPHPKWPIFQMSYFYFQDLYAGANTKALLEPSLCLLPSSSWSMSALALAVVVPVALGIVAAALMAAAMNDELRQVDAVDAPPTPAPAAESPPAKEEAPGEATRAPPDDDHWPVTDKEVRLQVANGRLKRCLYLLSIGLMTSTIAVSLFFHLPAKLTRADRTGMPSALSFTYEELSKPDGACAATPPLKPGADPRAANLDCFEQAGKLRTLQNAELAAIDKKLDEFGSELSLFWATVFALTLLAAAGVPAIRLQRRVRDYVESIPATQRGEVRTRLMDEGILHQSADQAKFLLAILAPLATGPLTNLFQAVAAG